MKLEDLELYVTMADTSISADGRVVFGTKRMNLEEDRYDSNIWLADQDRARKLTAGPGDTSPKFSPDGTRVAFLRKGPEKTDKPQLAVIDVRGGEAEVLTDFSMGCRTFDWSPDSRQLVVSAVEYHSDWAELDSDGRGRKPARVTKLPMRMDTAGQYHNTIATTWLVPSNGDSPVKLSTEDQYREEAAMFSPDGTKVAFASDRTGRKVATMEAQVWERTIASGDLRMRADLGMWTSLAYSDSGELHSVGLEHSFDWPDMLKLWRFDDSGPIALTAELDRGVQEVVFDGDEAVLLVEDAGRVVLKRLTTEGAIVDVSAGDSVVSSVSVANGKIAFVESDYVNSGELMVADGGGLEKRTSFNEAAIERMVRAQHFTVSSGEFEVDVWVYLPDGTEQVPVLLNIHGGPASQYSYGFFDEFQMYLGAGYGVVACNPRGSSGKGSAHVKGVVGEGWGVNDLADIEVALDAALERFGRLDANRVGVMGGSYGGFMTAWITARDHRFKSSVVERGLLSWTSFAGTSDIGPYFPEMYLGANLPADPEALWQASPLAQAHNIRVPTLIVHSENDFRCPIEQAEQLFTILLRSGVETEMVRFPGESHELTRSGKPQHRKERFEAILDWHGRFLLAAAENLAN